jgi:hypothetical protein
MAEELIEIKKNKYKLIKADENKRLMVKNILTTSTIPFYDLGTIEKEITKKVIIGKDNIKIKKSKLRYKEIEKLLDNGYKVYSVNKNFLEQLLSCFGIIKDTVKISWK